MRWSAEPGGEALGRSLNAWVARFVSPQRCPQSCGILLGFAVEYGRYRGVQWQIGHDGFWTSPTGKHVVVEVKTTDTYTVQTTRSSRNSRDASWAWFVQGTKRLAREDSEILTGGR